MHTLNEHVTIVMVEDDPGHAKLIERNLRRAGISNALIHFDTGQKVLDFLFAETPNFTDQEQLLVLLDLNLPEVDGFEVLTRVKNDLRTRLIPVIILTTTDNPREIDRCYALGCNVYVIKPVEYDSFSDAIKRLGLMLSVVKLPGGTG
ncbi:MAG: response regulator [Rickettsiales bacterium]|nr:response regulator [Rickettsiales bacterium]